MMDIHKNGMYHMGIQKEDGAPIAILTGDPGRVESIASHWDNPKFLASNREFTTWSGEWQGHRVLISSHGIGGPSMAICAEELYRCGVRTMIRVGTCGGMDLKVKGGDLVVATGAIRQEGTGREYLPIEFPAVADLEVSNALVAAAKEQQFCVYPGVVQCKDSFYGQHSPEDSGVSYQLKDQWQAWLKGGCLASEMESAALYIVAATHGIRAGCVLQVVWNQERFQAGLDNPQCSTTEPAIATACLAVKKLMRAEQ